MIERETLRISKIYEGGNINERVTDLHKPVLVPFFLFHGLPRLEQHNALFLFASLNRKTPIP